MKIIHCADIHLSSKMSSKLGESKARERRLEIIKTFERMLAYARENDVKYVLFSGDVFDSDEPYKTDKDYFYGEIKEYSDIEFYYLKGNHDIATYNETSLPNLHLFESTWKSYEINDNVVISGIEMSKDNQDNIYKVSFPIDKLNIVMLHGDISSANKENGIDLKALKGKNIDYLALGHIHLRSNGKIDERGVYYYPGCLEGRGFDETGKKGFELLTIEKNKISVDFIDFAYRTIYEFHIDTSGAKSQYEVNNIIKDNIKDKYAKKDLLSLYVVGEIDFDNSNLSSDVEDYFNSESYYTYCHDNTTRKIDINQFKGDLSLRGTFVKNVLANEKYTEEEKMKIITCGLKALNGEVNL